MGLKKPLTARQIAEQAIGDLTWRDQKRLEAAEREALRKRLPPITSERVAEWFKIIQEEHRNGLGSGRKDASAHPGG